jgi:hypothetical protein
MWSKLPKEKAADKYYHGWFDGLVAEVVESMRNAELGNHK